MTPEGRGWRNISQLYW